LVNLYGVMQLKTTVLLFAAIVVTGCASQSQSSHHLFAGTLNPVISTDVAGEYVIQARDTTAFTSSEKVAEENAIKGAIEFCNKLGQDFKKRYNIPTPAAPRKWADATLHFRCVTRQ
jgi:hypothetical protein